MYKAHNLSLNSFIISLCLNLVLLLILSIWRENPATIESKEAVKIEFSRLSKTIPHRRTSIILPKSSQINLKSINNNPIAPTHLKSNSKAPVSSILQEEPKVGDIIQSFSFRSPQDNLPLPGKKDNTSAWGRGSDVLSRSLQTGSTTSIASGNRGITIRQPDAFLSGSGDKLRGYYNISLVKYEDTSDTVSNEALINLAKAMNNLTEIKTKVIKEPIMLDDPEILQLPMVYITSSCPFAFSEKERENLRKYFSRGGFLLFSNIAAKESEIQGVYNSIEFELWKILGKDVGHLNNVAKNHNLYDPFYQIPNNRRLMGATLKDRIIVVYENSGYGNKWAKGDEIKDELYKLGINIIIYALTTSPMVQKN